MTERFEKPCIFSFFVPLTAVFLQLVYLALEPTTSSKIRGILLLNSIRVMRIVLLCDCHVRMTETCGNAEGFCTGLNLSEYEGFYDQIIFPNNFPQ